ncbi:DUF1885 family protein [Salinibacillus aidingensis]|uniref:DUF1885 family protein n=1 Tax=Salinibacillus aidingensis TaxID=237684 RepID=A0ABN1BC33_9BACI
MSRSSFVYADESNSITLENVKEWLNVYQEMTTKTGQQLDWNYENHAFPYNIEEKENDQGHYLQLKGILDRYDTILMGVSEEANKIQITLPSTATHGDKSKANEFAKFFRKKTGGKLQLFNGRVMSK